MPHLPGSKGYLNMMQRGGSSSEMGGVVYRSHSRPQGIGTQSSGLPGLQEAESTSFSVRAMALYGEEADESCSASSTRAAGARLLGGLQSMTDRTLNLEAGSVYGAVILMPQIARTLGWPAELSSLVVTSVTYHLLLIFLHGSLLTFIDQEQVIQDAFAGQMHLCNFGAGSCGNADGCPGPGGTTVTPPRIYNWNTWATRTFFRDSMQALWPEKAEDIAKLIDPGEYGVESSLCRLLCCFVFVMMIAPEIGLCWEMANLLWHVPSEDEPWVTFREGRPMRGPRHEWLDMISVRIAGMNRLWKAACAVIVLLPKCFLCVYSAKAGVVFLMETSDIDTIIVNSVALVFLLSLDEVMANGLMHDQVKKLLHICEPFVVDGSSDGLDGCEDMDDAATLHMYEEQCAQTSSLRRLLADLFLYQYRSFYIVLLLTPLLVGSYFFQFCEFRDGQYVSHKMFFPKSTAFTALNTFLPGIFPVEYEEDAFWEMPTSDA
mmetsp:Transcript_48859/g.114841  ORF Transcript_48859/g.114841 Transcript_48859/m.114841 type:complete len:489 (-) Transcript_48859:46-1512(-)